jgi:hypothetical protein
MEEEKIKDNNLAKVKILKCNTCNTVPYFKFYKENYNKEELNIFLKCKCNQINTRDFDILKEYFISIDKMPKKEHKFKSNYLTDDVYKQILNGYKLAKEKIYVKLKEIRDEELKVLYDRIEKIKNVYQETLKQNEKILNIIQILIDTYENYIAENYKTFEILSHNIINNTNFNLEIKNIFNDRYYSEEKIIYANNYKYNLQHIKTISLPILDYDNYNNYYIELNLLSNKKLLAFCKKKNEKFENKIIYMSLNDDYTIKSEKIIDNYFDYSNYFEIDKEKLFFYKDKDEISYILNIKTFEISKFYLNYNSFFNYINGNIIGFNSNVIGILNLKGEILLSKETEEKNYELGLLLLNNNLLFSNSNTIFLLDEKLNEIKSKKLNHYYYSMDNITNFGKKIIVKYMEQMYVLNSNLDIETIIYYYNHFNTIYRFYINHYISFYSFNFIFLDNKKYMIYEYDIPYLFPPYNNKIIFGRLRNEKNKYKRFKLFYENKKIFILYSNNLLIYQPPI